MKTVRHELASLPQWAQDYVAFLRREVERMEHVIGAADTEHNAAARLSHSITDHGFVGETWRRVDEWRKTVVAYQNARKVWLGGGEDYSRNWTDYSFEYVAEDDALPVSQKDQPA